MTTSTYSPALLQSPYGQLGQLGPYGQSGQFGIAGFDQSAPFQQFTAGMSPYGPQVMSQFGQQGIEQILPAIQLITHQLATAQQCVWTAQHLFAQVVPQIAQIQQQQTLPFQQFGQPFGQPFGQFGQRQLPRQYPTAW